MVDSDYIPLSYLSQYYYCPRRAGLLMLEQLWRDNSYTANGVYGHRIVHNSAIERRGRNVKIFELSIYSQKLLLAGKCDCVEAEENDKGIYLPMLGKAYDIYPVEYKHGVIRDEAEYNIQLCAQAMCMEEMFEGEIQCGAIFYIDSHRRIEVEFSAELRRLVTCGAEELMSMLNNQKIPDSDFSPKCRKCSVADDCMPRTLRSAASYLTEVKKYLQE